MKIEAVLTSSCTGPSAAAARSSRRPGLAEVGQVGLDDAGDAALERDLLGERCGGVDRAVAVDRHGETVCRQVLDDGAADPLRSAGNQRRTVCSSCLTLAEFVECRLRPQFAAAVHGLGVNVAARLCLVPAGAAVLRSAPEI